MIFRALVLSIFTLSLTACNMSGSGQKGPFKAGSNVTVSRLNSQALLITSGAVDTQVNSNQGNYSAQPVQWNGWTQVSISGQYFDEFSGADSSASLTLDAITTKNKRFDTANLHLYSHLAAARIRQRVTNGQSRTRAWKSTQTEMKRLFDLKKVSTNINRGVEQLSLLNGRGRYRKDNANLLLFTGSFLATGGNASSLASLANDFADDGEINGAGANIFNAIAIKASADGLLNTLSQNLRNNGAGNPPNSGDMSKLPKWVIEDAGDVTAPVITLLGENPVEIDVGTPYEDAGAAATDDVDEVVTATAIDNSDVIDTSVAGTHTVTYRSTDEAGNSSTETRTVNVNALVDITPPVITVTGTNPITIVVGTPYVDEGATATDDVDGEVAANAIDGSDVINTSEPATFTVTYSATDIAGNTSSATREVVVTESPDTTPPVLILLGDNPDSVEVVVVSEVPFLYQDPGYTVTDNRDESINVEVTGTVDTSTLGSYVLSYLAADVAGNSVTESRTVEVVDTTAPVITLNGANVISVVAGTVYEDAGATATDNFYGVLDVMVSGAVDTNTVGSYTLTYTAEDGSNNTATETRTVTVTEAPDSTAPVITLLGDTSVTVEAGTSYSDAGATALDNKDGDLTGAIVIGGSVNVNVPATYVLTYNVQDAVPNTAIEVTRTVIVSDTIAPVITLTGESAISLVEGSSYTDAGATASDSLDGDITTNIAIGGDTVDTNTLGVYIITYNVMDHAQNPAAQVTRTVTITEAPDTIAPVITLLGNASVTVEAGTSYTDAGATALDDKDGDLTGAIVVGGSVNVNVPATYILSYNVQDAVPNAADEVTRTVIVEDTLAPTITLLGDAALVIQKDASYTDAGATASDSLDGDITANISVDNPVNPSSPAIYTVTYIVSDAAGNPATAVTRSVRVNAPPSANAGSDVSVETGNSVDLVGSGSDADGAGTVSYQWMRGSEVLSTSASYSYTAENSETLTFVVTDSDGAVTTDTVNITVTLPAAYQIVFVTDTTTVPRNLEAALFSQGLQFIASVVDGSGNPVATAPTFDPTVVDLSTPGTYPVEFSYTDPYNRVITKELTVVVENHAPLATSASITVDEDSANNSITLVASDANQGDTLTYTVNQPSHGAVTGTYPDVTYTPTPNFAGSDSFTFTVSDGIAESTGTISITVTDIPEPNNAPLANAGADTSVEVNASVTLSGSASTDDGTITNYSWYEEGVLLHSSDHFEFVYTPTSEGPHTITLTVMDDYEATDTDTVIVTATAGEVLAATCPATPTTEAAFTDTFINLGSPDQPWPDNLNNVPLTVDDIANVFNSTRAFTDPFGLQGKKLVMPAQAVWDAYTDSQKALFLINSERCARGILPYEGISPSVETSPAQYYADYLSSNNVFGHNEDGSSPHERLAQLAGVVTPGNGPENADFFSYAENLAVNSLGSTGAHPTVHEPVAKAIYAWMYDDKESTKVNIAEPPAVNYIYTYGHRKFILAKGLVENSGEADKEGLIGIGVSTVETVENGFNWTKVYTVMNAFDPNENWSLGDIQMVDLLGSNQCLEGYTPVIDSSPLVCEQQ